MKHMVKWLVCLAAVAGLGFGAFGEGFSDDNIACADESVRAIPIGNRTAYVFTNTTAEAIAVTVKRDITIEKLLVVGGGGAGGYHFGGGGGGGGVVYEPNFAQLVQGGGSLAVQVGAGGTGKKDANWRDPGKASWLAIGAVTNMAYGGGSGGCYDNGAASTGQLGSGGGGNNQKDGTTYTKGQGNAGGSPAGLAGGGGGGGASEPGQNGGQVDEAEPTKKRGGNGGEGRTIDITGENIVYGSGGGGSGRPYYSGGGKAGKGGTNAANAQNSKDGVNGASAPDGFGGGGAGAPYAAGGNGGSGTVILQVAAGDQRQYQFTVLPIPEQLYLGTPLRPEPVVSNLFTGAILVKDRDYTVDYEGGSLEPGELTGRGTVIVRGKSGAGYSGRVERMAYGILGPTYSDDRVSIFGDDQVGKVMVGNRSVYAFTNVSVAAQIVLYRDVTVEKMLVVGGGGGGSGTMGGGGGAGGLLYSEDPRYLEGGTRLVVSVGKGGAGQQNTLGGQGGDSSLGIGDETPIIARGGGGGGGFNAQNAADGGSGGGGTYGKASTIGKGIPGQGHDGGCGYGNAGGGGGGAGGAAVASGSVEEGVGLVYDITGEAIEYARGGKGGAYPNMAAGAPGKDGVGQGGGGGGQVSGVNYPGARGGNGTVILCLAKGDTARCQFKVLPLEGRRYYYLDPVRPEPVVSNTVTGAILEKNVDYTLEYENDTVPENARTGVGTVWVHGKVDTGYEGLVDKATFEMTRAYQFEIAPIADMLHYHEPVTPEPVLTNAVLGVVPVKGDDYRVEYENNNAEGTATVRAIGIGNYTGFATEQTFTLIRAYQFEVAPVPSQLYVGDPVKPEPAVTNAILGVVPVKDTDYRVEYESNDAIGTATMRVIGLGDYEGYEIARAFALVAPAFDDGIVQASSATTFERQTLGKRAVYIFTNVTEETALYVNRDITIEKMLVVGGGGGGGGTMGAGGGAGGLVYSEEPLLLRGGMRLAISIGKGGAGHASSLGGQGGDSAMEIAGGESIVAKGGGGGGGYGSSVGSAGGSGGGSCYGKTGAKGTPGQGHDGGSGYGNAGGGGGGAGGAAVASGSVMEGAGLVCDITGEPLEYARGGRGGAYNVGIAYEPAGTDGRGNGGGGGGKIGNSNYSGTRGGSGTVILYVADHDTVNFRYAIANPGEQVYFGGPVRPKPAVSNVVTGAVLTEGVDFTYAYENCDTYGRGRVIANGVDGSDYDGCYALAEFDIVNGFQFAVEPISRQAFIGEPVCPSVTVVNTVVGGILSEDTDYTVAYENNEAPGQARAIVSGMTGTGYEGFAVTSNYVIAETYVDEFAYTTDASVRPILNGTRRVYVFTNVAETFTFNIQKDMTLNEYLIVGGGGGGSGTMGGGGGAGGLVYSDEPRFVRGGVQLTVAVGKGGVGQQNTLGGQGGDSSLGFGNETPIIARGGGGGGGFNARNAADGGSGGGGTYGNANTIGKGIPGQGHDGGCGYDNAGGGGGGAGGAAVASGSVEEGVGLVYDITGEEIEYARGGKGGAYPNMAAGAPGKDGVGQGGGGGGQVSGVNYPGARGGSGTVILAFVEGGKAGQPELDEKDVDFGFVGEFTVPRVAFQLGGEPDAIYSASVTVSFGVGEETEPRQTRVFTNKTLGSEVSSGGDFSPATGSEVWCRIEIESDGAETRIVRLTRTATGKVAPYAGHGGGEGVLHVWADAPGDGSGSDWFNAMTDVRKALEGLSVQKPNIWICGVVTAATACAKTTLTAPAAIRGGFTGVEDDPSERPRGARSVLDGGDQQNILLVAGNHLLTLDSIEFTHAKTRAVERTGGALFVTNCNFEANGTTVERLAARALYASGSASVTADFVDTRFAKNTEKGTYAEEGCCVLLSSFKRATFDNCTFMTNGIIPNVVSGTTGYGEGNVFKGAALKVDGVPLTMRNCRFFANRAACRGGNGGTVRLFNGSYPSAFTNCLFVGNSERQPHPGADQAMETGGGAIVLDLGNASGLVEVDTCTFAWNSADCRQSSAGINVRKGALRVRNSIFWKNWRRDVGTAGTDIDVKADGSADVDYSLFAATNEACITTADAAKLTLGGHIVCGDPKFFTRDDDLAGIVKTNANKSSFNFIYLDWNRLNELVRFNAHLRGGRHVDETTGTEVFAAGRSPAINAGDPAHGWSNEPAPNGRRVNMGFYGNTPWATTSPGGTALIVR